MQLKLMEPQHFTAVEVTVQLRWALQFRVALPLTAASLDTEETLHSLTTESTVDVTLLLKLCMVEIDTMVHLHQPLHLMPLVLVVVVTTLKPCQRLRAKAHLVLKG